MRMRYVALPFALLGTALGLAACGKPPPRYANPAHGTAVTVLVWIDPAAGLPANEVVAGCNMWREMDVECFPTLDRAIANVSVFEDRLECLPGKEGKRTLAYASSKMHISARKRCFSPTAGIDDKDERRRFQLVMAHEFGHVFGIWTHVEPDCDKKASAADGSQGHVLESLHDVPEMPQWPEGITPAFVETAMAKLPPVCGPAIMNPYLDDDLDYLTPNDKTAFDRRDHYYSALDGWQRRNGSSGAPDTLE